jgi:hypothetical protein
MSRTLLLTYGRIQVNAAVVESQASAQYMILWSVGTFRARPVPELSSGVKGACPEGASGAYGCYAGRVFFRSSRFRIASVNCRVINFSFSTFSMKRTIADLT